MKGMKQSYNYKKSQMHMTEFTEKQKKCQNQNLIELLNYKKY